MNKNKPEGKVVHVSGKRKEAVSRTTIKEGEGVIRVNRKPLEFFQPIAARMRVEQALKLASEHVDLSSININVRVNGGGVMGQADAIASSIARGLVEWSENDQLLERYHGYDRTIIAGDYRQTEVHKPGQSSKGPRHKRQKSYR
ncbi:30S ribosomal protein S9 [Candidatus Altiarchaeota archaeon]